MTTRDAEEWAGKVQQATGYKAKVYALPGTYLHYVYVWSEKRWTPGLKLYGPEECQAFIDQYIVETS